MTAGHLGHMVVHFTFAGHRLYVPHEEGVVLNDEQLRLADPYLHRAAKSLDRRFPARADVVNNLLRRNWYQVRDSERVYAVACLDTHQRVEGGTAWAVQMFMDRLENKAEVYLFEQAKGLWLAWDGAWTPIDEVPEPHGVWTGIGTRDLNDVGKQAIRTLMKYTPVASQSSE